LTTEDRIALRELVERYALGIDRRESDAVAGTRSSVTSWTSTAIVRPAS
jgi:hypothetical protein